MIRVLQPRWRLAIRVIPVLVLVAAFKSIAHYYGFEPIDLGFVLTALISANLFLLSFNISGVLNNYKEGEKLPGKLAASIEAIADECVFTYKGKNAKEGKEAFLYCIDFTS